MDAIFIKDRSLRYTQVNPAMERLFDRPTADLIGKTDRRTCSGFQPGLDMAGPQGGDCHHGRLGTRELG